MTGVSLCMRLRLLIFLLWLCGLAAPLHAQEQPLAWYRFNPRVFGATAGAVLPFALQAADRAGVLTPEFHPLFDAILAGSVAGSVQHEMHILRLDAELDETAPNGFRLTDLQVVLILQTGGNHRSFVQALGTILSHYRQGKEGEEIVNADGELNVGQELFDLTGGLRAARFRAPGWAAWQSVEWASLPDSFIVGVGRGSLESWQNATRPNESPVTQQHRNALLREPHYRPGALDAPVGNASTVECPAFLELFIDLDALRRIMPEILAQGRPRDLLQCARLDNARNWMLHGRLAGRFVLCDLTWQRRSDDPTTVIRRQLTVDAWPESLPMREAPGSWVLAAPIDLEAAQERIVDLYRSFLRGAKQESFDEAWRKHRLENRRLYEAMWPQFAGWLILGNYPPAPIPAPGAVTLYLPLAPRASERLVENQIASLVTRFTQGDAPTELGHSRLQRDQERRLFWLQTDSQGMLRLPTWGMAPGMLVAGWGPEVVEANREWISAPRRR